MPNSKKNTSHVKIAFLDFVPAELKLWKDWIIVYYFKNPISQQLERKRVRVPVIEPKKERLKYAKKIVLEINSKLNAGWSPYIDIQDDKYKVYADAIKTFKREIIKENKDNIKRNDTIRAYNSYLSMIDKYCNEKKLKLEFVFEMNKRFISNYLNYIYIERNNSPVTHNNHLTFIKNLCNYFINKGYITSNPSAGILPKNKAPKKRLVISNDVKEKLKLFGEKEPGYFVLCMITYFCFVRRTELTKIKVGDINCNERYITIIDDNSKNKITANVTIPEALILLLQNHIFKAAKSDYLFSADFKPGKKQLQPKKISDTWVRFRKEYKISTEYQFYSLKDTGITELLESGIPAIKVRDQARHHDIKITESYTSRNKFSDEMIRNANFKF